MNVTSYFLSQQLNLDDDKVYSCLLVCVWLKMQSFEQYVKESISLPALSHPELQCTALPRAEPPPPLFILLTPTVLSSRGSAIREQQLLHIPSAPAFVHRHIYTAGVLVYMLIQWTESPAVPEWNIGWSEGEQHLCDDERNTGAICSPWWLFISE